MDVKKAKYIDAIFSYCQTDLTRDNDAIQRLLDDLLAVDAAEAFTMWEYLLTRREKKLTEPKQIDLLIHRPLSLLYQKTPRTSKAVLETPMLAKAVYFYSPDPVAEIPLEITIYGLVAGKYKETEEVFKLLQKNTAAQRNYGEHMKIVVEKLFFEMLKKKGGASKKVDLPKKLCDLLNAYVKKITGPEKSLLEQRIKEVM